MANDDVFNAILIISIFTILISSISLSINIEEIKDFCIKLDYEYKLVEKNFVPKTAEDRLLISPPQKNLEVEDWGGDNNNNRDIDLNTIKENLEKLL